MMIRICLLTLFSVLTLSLKGQGSTISIIDTVYFEGLIVHDGFASMTYLIPKDHIKKIKLNYRSYRKVRCNLINRIKLKYPYIEPLDAGNWLYSEGGLKKECEFLGYSEFIPWPYLSVVFQNSKNYVELGFIRMNFLKLKVSKNKLVECGRYNDIINFEEDFVVAFTPILCETASNVNVPNGG